MRVECRREEERGERGREEKPVPAKQRIGRRCIHLSVQEYREFQNT